MELFVDIATRFGVPTAILGIVLLYHARVIREKDKELARVNELRVSEATNMGEKMLVRFDKYSAVMTDVEKTIGLLIRELK